MGNSLLINCGVERQCGLGPTSEHLRHRTKRRRVEEELVATESSFVHDLEALDTDVRLPLMALAEDGKLGGITTVDQLESIFLNVSELASLHGQLLSALQESSSSPDLSKPQTIIKFAPTLRAAYTIFVRGFGNSMRTLSACKEQDEELARVLDEKKAEGVCRGLDVASVLIQPIQRIPRLKLLLLEMQKHTPDDDSMYDDEHRASLQTALDVIEELAQHCNEMRARAEEMEQLLKVQGSMKHNRQVSLVRPDRYVERSETVKALKSSLSVKPDEFKEHMVVLFNDGNLLWCNTESRFKGMLDLSMTTCEPGLASEREVVLDGLERTTKKQVKLVMRLPSVDDQLEWLQSLEQHAKSPPE